MKHEIKFVHWYSDDDYSFRARMEIKWMSKKISFLDWEPEDNNLSRNFNNCYNIASLLMEANKMWINWIELEVETIEDNDIWSDNYS